MRRRETYLLCWQANARVNSCLVAGWSGRVCLRVAIEIWSVQCHCRAHGHLAALILRLRPDLIIARCNICDISIMQFVSLCYTYEFILGRGIPGSLMPGRRTTALRGWFQGQQIWLDLSVIDRRVKAFCSRECAWVRSAEGTTVWIFVDVRAYSNALFLTLLVESFGSLRGICRVLLEEALGLWRVICTTWCSRTTIIAVVTDGWVGPLCHSHGAQVHEVWRAGRIGTSLRDQAAVLFRSSIASAPTSLSIRTGSWWIMLWGYCIRWTNSLSWIASVITGVAVQVNVRWPIVGRATYKLVLI